MSIIKRQDISGQVKSETTDTGFDLGKEFNISRETERALDNMSPSEISDLINKVNGK